MSNGVAMTVAPEGRAVDVSIIERVIATGDLTKLQPADRVAYYVAVCRSVGLNPLTKPFDYISLNGKLTLYSTKNCTDQLRQIHGVSVDGLRRETHDSVHIVTANVSSKDGRRDEDIGAVSLKGLSGENLANALMKATTKAKRRATLSICGLSFVDESELESTPGAQRVTVTSDGEVIDSPRLSEAPKSDQATFAELCQAIDAAESKAALNKVAAATRKAKADGKLVDADYTTIVRASNAKAALLADRPSEPRPPSEPPPSGEA
jgi:hypothetical protein